MRLNQKSDRDSGNGHEKEVLKNLVGEANHEWHRGGEHDRKETSPAIVEEILGYGADGNQEDWPQTSIEGKGGVRGVVKDVKERQQEQRIQGCLSRTRAQDGVEEGREALRGGFPKMEGDFQVVGLIPLGCGVVTEDENRVPDCRHGNEDDFSRAAFDPVLGKGFS